MLRYIFFQKLPHTFVRTAVINNEQSIRHICSAKAGKETGKIVIAVIYRNNNIYHSILYFCRNLRLIRKHLTIHYADITQLLYCFKFRDHDFLIRRQRGISRKHSQQKTFHSICCIILQKSPDISWTYHAVFPFISAHGCPFILKGRRHIITVCHMCTAFCNLAISIIIYNSGIVHLITAIIQPSRYRKNILCIGKIINMSFYFTKSRHAIKSHAKLSFLPFQKSCLVGRLLMHHSFFHRRLL